MSLKTAQILEIFGTSNPTLSRWRKDGAECAYIGRDSWDGGAFLQWWLENIYAAGVAAMDAEKLRLARAKADREEMRRDKEAKRLMETAVVEQYLFNSGRTIRDQVQAVPDRVAALVAAEQDPFACKQILKKEFDFILHGLAKALTVKDEKVQKTKKEPKLKVKARGKKKSK